MLKFARFHEMQDLNKFPAFDFQMISVDALPDFSSVYKKRRNIIGFLKNLSGSFASMQNKCIWIFIFIQKKRIKTLGRRPGGEAVCLVLFVFIVYTGGKWED